ncbi:hypothetical protein H2201_007028 [Coniosporium apollinis]|uniref:Uncharacterized protein n=1 Tax=Coniosporium apollinis TaxID=61459 RepID=A0ABQ9NK19_9PEZI|nr:hypothetical protein H2201_007028 [Coniosporium apollinis]
MAAALCCAETTATLRVLFRMVQMAYLPAAAGPADDGAKVKALENRVAVIENELIRLNHEMNKLEKSKGE